MAMGVRSIGVRCDDRLRIVTKILSYQSLGYLVGNLGRNILRIRKADYVMDRFNRSLTLQRRRAVVFVSGIVLVNRLHLQIGVVSIGGAIYRDRVKLLLGLIGIKYVPQTFVHRGVDRNRLNVWQSSATSTLSFSTFPA